MPVRKMRVEVYDERGNRYTVSLEGRVTRKKALQVLDIIELLGGMRGIEPELRHPQELSKFERVQFIVERHFPLAWFSSKDVQSLYEGKTEEPISLSTVSTYLSRLSDRGILMKTRNSNRVSYRLVSRDVRQLVKSV